jgi:hypothetical protein
MTRREDETQQVIVDILVEHRFAAGRLAFEFYALDRQFAMFAVDQRGAAQPIERPILCDLRQPGSRLTRDAIPGPVFEGEHERVLHNFLGQADIAQISGEPGSELRLLDPPDRFDCADRGQGFSDPSPFPTLFPGPARPAEPRSSRRPDESR